MSEHPVVRQVANLLGAGDPRAAENALVCVAEAEGDHALVAVLESLPERDLIAVLREFDSSHDTPVAALVSPEKFARVIGLEAQYNDKGHDRLRGMINAVLLRDEDATDDYLAALADCESGLFALRDYFSDHHPELEYLAQHGRLDADEVETEDWSAESAISLEELLLRQDEHASSSNFAEHRDGDWIQIAWLLRHHHLECFADVLRLLRKQHASPVDALEKLLAIGGTGSAGGTADGGDEESAL